MPQSQRRTIPFIGQEARLSRGFQVDNQETLNLINRVLGQGAKAPVVLASAPGLVELGAIGDGPCRTPTFVEWTHPTDRTKDAYAVFGTAVVRISASLGFVTIGNIPLSTTRVRIARGRTHIMLVDGSHGYTYDGTTFAQIADLDFPDADFDPVSSPTHVVYLDGFFIVNDARSDRFYISAVEDPTSWNALDFDAAAVAPDEALAVAATESELWLIGDETAQAFYNSGNADFPFAIILGATQESGIEAPQSIAESDAGIFYLATTPEGGRYVYQIRGHSGQVISQQQQEDFLATIPDVSNAYGFIYQQAGNSFYVLQLDDDFPTLVYNIRARAWETRAMSDGSAWRIAGHGKFNRGNVGGSRFGGIIYSIDLNNFEDAGTPLIRRRVTQVQHLNNHLLEWWELVVDGQAGVGLPSGNGSDPMVRLRYSDDGGNSWAGPLEEPLGKEGEGDRRAVFRNLGSSRNRVFEVEYSDPVPVTITAAYARVELLED